MHIYIYISRHKRKRSWISWLISDYPSPNTTISRSINSYFHSRLTVSSKATDEEILSLHELDLILSWCVNLGTSRARAWTVTSLVHSNNIVGCSAVIEYCKIYKNIWLPVHFSGFIFQKTEKKTSYLVVAFLLTKYITSFKTLSFRPARNIEGPATRASNSVGCCVSHIKMEQQHAQHNRDCRHHRTASSLNHFLRDKRQRGQIFAG